MAPGAAMSDLSDGKTISERRGVFCPTCGAKPGEACRTSTGGKVKGYHPARADVVSQRKIDAGLTDDEAADQASSGCAFDGTRDDGERQ